MISSRLWFGPRVVKGFFQGSGFEPRAFGGGAGAAQDQRLQRQPPRRGPCVKSTIRGNLMSFFCQSVLVSSTL